MKKTKFFLLQILIFTGLNSIHSQNLLTGTEIKLKFTNSFTNDDKTDPIVEVKEEMKTADGEMIIQQGAKVEIKTSNKKSEPGVKGNIEITFVSVTAVDGQKILLTGSFVTEGKKGTNLIQTNGQGIKGKSATVYDTTSIKKITIEGNYTIITEKEKKKLALLNQANDVKDISSVYNAFIIGKDINIYTSYNTDKKIIRKAEKNEQVTITGITKKYDFLGSADSCEAFHWVKVKLSNDSTGWIYSKYVYYYEQTNLAVDFTFSGKKYKLMAFNTDAISGYEDEMFFELCGGGLFPYFVIYDYTAKKTSIVSDPFKKGTQNLSEFGYAFEGFVEKLKLIKTDASKIYIKVEASIQDYFTTDIQLSKVNDEFRVIAVSR